MILRQFAKAPKLPVLRAGLWLLLAMPLFGQITILNTSFPNATVGKFYSAGFTVSGGVQPLSWSATGSVPPGLTVNSTGSLTGVPTAAGSYSFALNVIDALGASARKNFTLVVTGSAVTITTASPLPQGNVGQSYTASLTATGGTAPYRWTATNLPAGLTLDSQTGAISGAPSTAGTFSFTVQVTDSAQATASANLSLTVNAAPLQITTLPPLFAGTVGVPYAQAFSASGGKPPYAWSITSGDTGGLTLDRASGILRGTPQAAGTFNFTVQVTDNAGTANSKAFSVVVSTPVLSIVLASPLPSGTAGVPYSQKLAVVATGGTPPYRWSVAGGSIAPGLDFNPDTLIVSGTPTAAGSFAFTLQLADAGGQTTSKPMTLVIAPPALTITTARNLPDGAINAPYTASLDALGGAQPYTWTAVGLPAGLFIDPSSGSISGVPTAAGSFGVAITVTDNLLSHVSDRFTMNISLPSLPAVLFSGLPATADPAAQYPLQVTLASPFPAAITGQAILTFSPDSGPTDKTVQFASGGTIATFSIPAGSTSAVSSVPLAIQTGTASGTINVSLRLQAGGIDVTPAPTPAISTQLARAAPVITAVRVTRTSTAINVIVSGYSTAREVTQATFTFGASAGQTLQAPASSIAIPVESLFTTWFQDPANGAYGTQFVLTQPFTVQGDPNAVIPQTVTLTNRVGSTAFRIP